MRVDVRACRIEEFPAVIDRLDQEFISRKGRRVSLQTRFPSTICLANLQQIRVAISEEELCGAYVVRLFDWTSQESVWRGAMVGMVWVDQRFRGRGIGRELMATAKEFLRERNVDFGVLWTGAHAFYEQSGWSTADCGLVGEVARSISTEASKAIYCGCLSSMEARYLEALRSKWRLQRVQRRAHDYLSIPVPADRVLCFQSPDDGEGKGFALVGEQDNVGYFYEIAAPRNHWGLLLGAIAGRFKHLMVNGERGEPFSQWLADQGYVAWRSHNKAMWLRVSQRAECAPLVRWHIPYFDWI